MNGDKTKINILEEKTPLGSKQGSQYRGIQESYLPSYYITVTQFQYILIIFIAMNTQTEILQNEKRFKKDYKNENKNLQGRAGRQTK